MRPIRSYAFAVVTALAVLAPASAFAAWPTTVGEDLVLSQPAGNGKAIQWLIPDASGGVYVGWLDFPPLSGTGVLRILRLDANGDVAPGWPASGLVPPRPSRAWSEAAVASDGMGGLFGAWPVGPTSLQRLALVRIGPDGALAPGWPASVDIAFGTGATSAFQSLQIVADPEGVYVSWLQTTSRLQRRLHDGTLAPGWMASGTPVGPDGEISMSTDGGTGVFVGWRDSYTHVLRLTSEGMPAPGWTADGVTFPVADPVGAQPIPIAPAPTDGVFAFDGVFRRIDADGAVPSEWPSSGVGLGIRDYIGGMAARADGSLLYRFTRQAATPPYTETQMVGALASDASTAAGWPAGGRSLGACFSPVDLWSDVAGFTMFGGGCGSPIPLVVRRFAPDGTASTGWASPTVTLTHALAQNLWTRQTRDALGGTVVGWSNFVSPGVWTTELRLKRMRDDGALGAGAVAAVETPEASGLALAPPWPNPAHGLTVLAFDLPRPMHATVALFDLSGRRVRTLVDGLQPAGRSAPRWDGRDGEGRMLPAGIYLAHLQTAEGTRVRRVALLP